MRRRRKKGIAALLLALCVALGLLPALTPAASAADNVTYLDANGATQTAASATSVTASDTAWGSAGSTTWYVVDSTLENTNRITVTGDVRLILADRFTLTASKGITVTGDNSLTIYAQSTGAATMGKLSATGEDNRAGIGGDGGAGGTITVNGGAVTANGGFRSAGIGGGNSGAGGTITVNGGAVTATGGFSGAGIGGGNSGAGGTITVNGGEVTANGGNYAAGIGGGDGYYGGGASGKITITGGTVNANGNVGGGAGIGGAGIGGGENGDNSGNGNSISITGGTVTATVPNGTNGAAIGNGGGNGTDVTVTIGAGATVEAGASADGTGAASVTDVANNTNYKYAKITIPPHTHDFTYSASGATITATCGAEDCTLTDKKATLSIAPSSSGGSAAELTGDVDEFDLTGVTITYQKKDSAGWQNTTEPDANATGIFKASVTLKGAGNAEVTASTAYGVSAITKGSATGDATGCDFTVPKVAGVGAKIEPTPTLPTGYEIKKITVKDESQNDVSTDVSADTKGFIMPEYSVTVDIEFGKISSAITIVQPNTGGTITVKNGDATLSSGTSADYGDAITLSNTSATGFNFVSYKVTKTGDENTTIEASNGSFSMPDYPVTVTATFEGAPFGITTVCDPTIGGTVEITGGGVTTNENATTAKAGTEVTLTMTPATGFEVSTVKYNDTTITASEGVYKFTMPAEAVSVSATFAGHPVSVSLTVAGDVGTSCTAELLNDDFTAVTDTLKKNTGDKFVLRLNKDDDYSFRVAFDPGGDANITEFTKEQYEAYLAYAKQNKISVPANTVLAWVTMPGVSENSVTMTVTFSKLKTFTILYQPTGNSARAWCKFAVTKGGQEALYASEMNSDVEMGDGSKVYSFSVTAAFIPEKVAFVSTENASLTETDATALQTSLDNAAMTNVTASQTAPAQDSDWTSITNSGKFCVIGGNARTFIAAFVTDASAMTVYNSDTAEVDKGEKTNGVTYRVAVCVMDDSGNVTTAGTVTAPEAPAKEGYDFAGWRGFEGTAPTQIEKVYSAGDSINVYENTTLNAVWNHKNPTITLNLNGGTGGSNVSSVTYGSALTITENPAKNGYSFDGWTVGTNVTENGVFFSENSLFDFKTPITADLNLKAQWKHVHSYDCFQISDFGDKLSKYQKYATAIHIAICGCGDVQLMAHEFDSNGKCACGYAAELPETVTLNVSYGQWANGTYTEKMQALPETVKREQEVSIFAPGSWGSLQFSKWQYNANGSAWYDLTSDAYASFLIPASMTVRALYVNPVTNPQVDLSARRYDDYTEVGGKTYTMDNILFHMNYKLPDGCTFVDAGIKLGDNTGISYYELKEQRIGLTLDGRGTAFGLGALSSVVGFFAGDVDMMTTGGKAVSASASLPEYSTYYAERENSVLNEISAETLAQYMYEGKPINVEKYDPIYWQAKAVTKGMSGSMATLPPLRFAQKNNQNHYIYGIGWLRYKTPDGTTKTIYTPALATTLNGVDSSTPVTQSGS